VRVESASVSRKSVPNAATSVRGAASAAVLVTHLQKATLKISGSA